MNISDISPANSVNKLYDLLKSQKVKSDKNSDNKTNDILNLFYSKLTVNIEDKLNVVFEQYDNKEDESTPQEIEQSLASLQNYFSPENTASRIVDFALSKYNGENKADRQNYLDYIKPAIEDGFNEAIDLLKDMPKEIIGKANNTMDIINTLVDKFIETGDAPNVDKGFVDMKA